MKRHVKTIDAKATIRRAMEILVARKVTGLPVVEDTRLVGLITEKDILNLILRSGCQSSPVGEHMTARITTFDEADSAGTIVDCLRQQHFRRVPILRNGKLAGIISRADLIRIYLEALQISPTRPSARLATHIPTARQVMTLGLLTTKPQVSVLEAMRLIVAHRITGLPVVDDHLDMVGMVSEKDLLVLAYDPHIRCRQVGDLMSHDLTAVDVNTGLFDICGCLANASFRRLPVVEDGKLVGIISRSDLMMFILKYPAIMTRCATVGGGAIVH